MQMTGTGSLYKACHSNTPQCQEHLAHNLEGQRKVAFTWKNLASASWYRRRIIPSHLNRYRMIIFTMPDPCCYTDIIGIESPVTCIQLQIPCRTFTTLVEGLVKCLDINFPDILIIKYAVIAIRCTMIEYGYGRRRKQAYQWTHQV